MRSYAAALLIGAAFAQDATTEAATTMDVTTTTIEKSPMDICFDEGFTTEECVKFEEEGTHMFEVSSDDGMTDGDGKDKGESDDVDDSDDDELFQGKDGKKIRTALEMVEMFCQSDSSSNEDSDHEESDEDHMMHHDEHDMHHDDHNDHMDHGDDHQAAMDAAMDAATAAAHDATSGHMEHDMHDEMDHHMDHDMHREREHHGERHHRDGRDRMERAKHMKRREDTYLCNSALDIFHTLVARKDDMDDARKKAERAGMILTELAHGIGEVFGSDGASALATAGAAAVVLALY